MSILSPLAKLSLNINVASYGELYIISGTDLGIPNPTCLVLSVTGTDIPSGYDAECVINAFKSSGSNSSFNSCCIPAANAVILGVEKLVPTPCANSPSFEKDFTPDVTILPLESIPAFPP